jgi:hypothetical protein
MNLEHQDSISNENPFPEGTQMRLRNDPSRVGACMRLHRHGQAEFLFFLRAEAAQSMRIVKQLPEPRDLEN